MEFWTLFWKDMIYKLFVKVRNFLYDKNICKSRRAEVPTICIGNITVGGTGKTPHTEMVLRMLRESAEWGNKNLAVLSRGYGRKSRGFQQVLDNGSAVMFGDEPLQIKKKQPKVTVAVHKNRIEGCEVLCHPEKLPNVEKKCSRCINREFPSADLIVLDDAYQYRKLKASLNIVLVDYNRNVFNDRMLPFGSLRDLPERIYNADVVIVTKCPEDMDNWGKTSYADSLGYRDFRSSTCEGLTPDGRRQLIFFTSIHYGEVLPIYENSDVRYRYSKRVIMFSGIAVDTPFHNYLSDRYNVVRKFSFPDHHRYNWSDFNKIYGAAKEFPTAAIATTEKDAQRVLDYSRVNPDIQEKMFMVPIEVDFIDSHEREVFRRRLLEL